MICGRGRLQLEVRAKLSGTTPSLLSRLIYFEFALGPLLLSLLTSWLVSFSLTGWKLGWTYGPSHLMKNLCVAHQNCVYTCNTRKESINLTDFEFLRSSASYICNDFASSARSTWCGFGSGSQTPGHPKFVFLQDGDWSKRKTWQNDSVNEKDRAGPDNTWRRFVN